MDPAPPPFAAKPVSKGMIENPEMSGRQAGKPNLLFLPLSYPIKCDNRIGLVVL